MPGRARGGHRRARPEAVLARRDEVIHDLDDSGQLPWLEERGIELVPRRGAARRRAPGASSATTCSARKAVVVATGSGAAMPPIDGLDRGRAWNNRDATTAKRGAGEHDRARRRAGRLRARAGLGDPGHRGHPDRGRASGCSPARSPSPASRSRDALRDDFGVDVRTGRQGEPGRRDGGDGVVAELDDGARSRPTELLVAVGRGPRTAEIGLEPSGVEPARRLPRDRRPAAGRRARLALRRRRRQRPRPVHPHGQVPGLGRRREPPRPRGRGDRRRLGSPRVTFTDPQVAAVGKTLAAGEGGGHRRARGRRPRPTAPPAQASRARTPAAPRGWSSTRSAGRSSARPSPASRPPTSSTPRRSRSWARCRWIASGTRCRRSRPAEIWLEPYLGFGSGTKASHARGGPMKPRRRRRSSPRGGSPRSRSRRRWRRRSRLGPRRRRAGVVPPVALPVEAAARRCPRSSTSTARASMPASCAGVERRADRGDLGVGEGDPRRAACSVGDRRDLACRGCGRRRSAPGTCPCG